MKSSRVSLRALRLRGFLFAMMVVFPLTISRAHADAFNQVFFKKERLDVQLTKPGRCTFGDFDAIKLDLAHSKKNTKLFLSIESLTRSGAESLIAFEEISMEKLALLVETNEAELSLTRANTPQANSADVVGVFICKSEGSFRGCSRMPAEEINDVLKQYDPDNGYDPERIEPKDKVYFYKPGILIGRELWFIQERMYEDLYAKFDHKARETLSEVANRAKTGAFAYDLGVVLQKSSALGGLLASAPLSKITPFKVQIELPEIDPMKCGGR